MKYIKSIIFLFLTILLAQSAAAQDFTYEGITYTLMGDGNSCSTKSGKSDGLNGTIPGNFLKGDIVIPEKVSDGVREYTVVAIGDYSFYNNQITSLSIPESVFMIGTEAFAGCVNLTSFNLPESVKYLNSGTFRDCTNLSNVTLPYNLTTIAFSMFRNCVNLENINFPSAMTKIGDYAFEGCSGLKSVHFNSLNYLKSIGREAFSKCTGLTTLRLPESVDDIQRSAFYDCSGLTEIYLSSSLTEIQEYVFSGCSGLTSISFPSSLISIGPGAFRECSSLSQLSFPQSLESIGSGAFSNCTGLKQITLPAGITTLADYAFTSCPHLSIITYNASAPIPAQGNLFSWETYYKATLSMPNAPLEVIKSTYPWNHFRNISSSTGSENNPVSSLGENDFYYNGIIYTKISEVNHTCKTKDGNQIEIVGNKDYVAGNNCSGDLIIPATVSDGNSEFTVVQIGKYGFNNNELRSISLPQSIVEIGECAFANCIDLQSVVLPESIEEIKYYTFSGCAHLSSINFPNSIKSIGSNAFNGCKSLTKISLPSSLTSIQYGSFSGCEKLSSLSFPASLERIEGTAFVHCQNLSSISLPESLTLIGDEAFGYCYGLSSITLPASLAEIGYSAFRSCDNLMSVKYAASIPLPEKNNIFDNETYLKATLIMPNAPIESIYVTSPWCFFGNIVASDGSFSTQEFEFNGLVYSVVDNVNRTCITKGGFSQYDSKTGTAVIIPGNNVKGELVIPEKVSVGLHEYTVIGVGEYSFYKNDITSVEIPKSITEISYNSFSECKSLQTVKLPDTVTKIDRYAFNGDVSLKSINFPETLTEIGWYAFYDCNSLISLKLPASLTKIYSDAFYGCTGLIEVNYEAQSPIACEDYIFSPFTYKNATLNMPYASIDVIQNVLPWSRFKHINASDGVYNEPLPALSENDFEYDGMVYTVIDEELHTCKTRDGGSYIEDYYDDFNYYSGNAFSGDLIIPEKVRKGAFDYTVVAVGNRGFYATCVTSVSLPTTIVNIGDNAFEDCANLEAVHLPETLKVLGWSSFEECKKIKSIRYDAVDPVYYYSGNFFFSEETYNEALLEMPNAILSDITKVQPWCRFLHIKAKDGVLDVPSAGDDIEYQGIVYTVIDAEKNTLTTKTGTDIGLPGNIVSGDIILPASFTANFREYTIIEIGQYSFSNSEHLTAVTIPASVISIGLDAFADCPRLSSLVWKGNKRLQSGVVESIGNPNLLLYVDSLQYAPVEISQNVVKMRTSSINFECDSLVLTPGFAFYPVMDFVSRNSSMTKEFTQISSIDGCSGWETLVLPFDVKKVETYDGRRLIPFDLYESLEGHYPYWLCQATASGEWESATAIKAGIPYLISMPNNPIYYPVFNISGNVTFSSNVPAFISKETASPYAVTWASGREFRSLWLPLDDAQAVDAMGLNVNITNLTDQDGKLLPPGSAFHVDVEPQPLEAYVTRNGSSQPLRIRGSQSGVLTLPSEEALSISVEGNRLHLQSSTDRAIDIFSVDGMVVRRVTLSANVPVVVDALPQGLYLISGQKILLH